MQITGTNVTKHDDGRITVEFNGEGGEAIAVKMVASSALQEEAAVDHAKELMVQVATFGISDEAFEDAQVAAADAVKGDAKVDPSPTTGSFSAPNSIV